MLGMDYQTQRREAEMAHEGWRKGDASLLPDMVWSQPAAREMMEHRMGYPFGRPDLLRPSLAALESPLPTRAPQACGGLALPEPRLPEPIITPALPVGRVEPMVTPEVRGPSVHELAERFERPPVVSGSMEGFTVHPSISIGPVTLTADRVYEDAPYHTDRRRPGKSAAPVKGQGLLDKSIPVKDTSSRRVAVTDEGEIVVFDRTLEESNLFHGHIQSWQDLEQRKAHDIMSTLVKNGNYSAKGKFIKGSE
jgi:hypothetical protein